MSKHKKPVIHLTPQPKSITIGLALSDEEHGQLSMAAAQQDRTLSNFVRLAIKEKIARDEKGGRP